MNKRRRKPQSMHDCTTKRQNFAHETNFVKLMSRKPGQSLTNARHHNDIAVVFTDSVQNWYTLFGGTAT